MKYPFPFIGAGHGQYFEWLEIHLIFEKTPDAKAEKGIIACAPEPIRPEKEDFANNSLIVCSEQFVNLYIQGAYGSEDDKGDMSEYEASEGASNAFEEDLNRWLLEVHEICPIRVAFRPEDWEAGGTDLSDWHNASGEMVRAIIESWINDDVTNKECIENITHNALFHYFMDDPLSLRIIENCLSRNLFLNLLQDEEHAQLLKTKETELGLLKMMPSLAFDRTPFGAEVILLAVRANSDELKSKLHEVIQKQTIENIESLNRNWYNIYIAKDRFTKEIAEAYWMMMDALETAEKELTDLTVYNNIMAACSKEIHPGVPEERTKKAVAIGEKYAAKNPLMYWVTFSLQCELNDLENSLSNVEQYFNSNDPNKVFLTGELKKNNEYANFRNTPKGGAFVKRL